MPATISLSRLTESLEHAGLVCANTLVPRPGLRNRIKRLWQIGAPEEIGACDFLCAYSLPCQGRYFQCWRKNRVFLLQQMRRISEVQFALWAFSTQGIVWNCNIIEIFLFSTRFFLGWLHEAFGSYRQAFFVCGSFAIASSLLIFVVSCMVNKQRRRVILSTSSRKTRELYEESLVPGSESCALSGFSSHQTLVIASRETVL